MMVATSSRMPTVATFGTSEQITEPRRRSLDT
jgi:hypothetical protein